MFDPTSAFFWVRYADRSYVATRLLWFTGLQDEATVSAHRTIELYLKAFLVSYGEPVKPRANAWGHSLATLGVVSEQYSPEFARREVKRRLAFLQRYFDYVRYPSDQCAPSDGSGTWFCFDANIIPMDELTAFIRPRIRLETHDWQQSEIRTILSLDSPQFGYQKRALTDANEMLPIINCSETAMADVPFSESFEYDLPGC